MHLAKFPMLRFSRVYCPASFHPNSTKLYEQYGNEEGMQAVTFGDLPNVKGIWHFEEKLPQLRCHYPQSYVVFI